MTKKISPQAAAKAAQGFVAKPVPNSCSNCQHFTMDRTRRTYQTWNGVQEWTEEKNLRCSLGGFKVGKTSICKEHKRVTE